MQRGSTVFEGPLEKFEGSYQSLKISVSNSGQIFKTQVLGSWEKQPRKTQVFFEFWNQCDFEQ